MLTLAGGGHAAYGYALAQMLVAVADITTHFDSTILEALICRKPTVAASDSELTRTAGMEDANHSAVILNAMDKHRKLSLPIFVDEAKKLAIILRL